MVVQLLLGGQCKAGGDDGQCVCAQLLGTLAQADGLGGGDAAGACVDRYAALYLIDDSGKDLFLLLEGQGVGFAVGAHGEDAVHAACQQALHLLAQSLMVDRLLRVVVHGGDYGRDDALDIAGLHKSLLLFCYMIS